MVKLNLHRLMTVALLASAMAWSSASFAQVTVNAPSGLTNRQSTSTQKKQDDKPKVSETKKSETKSSSQEKHETTETKSSSESSTKTTTRKTQSDYKLSNQTVRKRAAGYRIQVYFSSSLQGRNEARSRAREVALKYPHYRTYISYVAPQWRLRIGDFKSKEEAQKALRKVRRSFPQYMSDIILVTDNINVCSND